MSDVAEVKEALDCMENQWCGIEGCQHDTRVNDTARRWVRMVSEGLDYEAAIEEYLKATARGRPMSLHPKTIVDIVDAAVRERETDDE